MVVEVIRRDSRRAPSVVVECYVVVWTVGRRVEVELEMFGDASSGAGLLWLWPRWTFVIVYVVPVEVVEVVVGWRGMMCRNWPMIVQSST